MIKEKAIEQKEDVFQYMPTLREILSNLITQTVDLKVRIMLTREPICLVELVTMIDYTPLIST